MDYPEEILISSKIVADNPELKERIIGLFYDYLTIGKPLISTVESYREEFPPEVLLEIRAAYDHLSRAVCMSTKESDAIKHIEKAESHTRRFIYDCYKDLVGLFADNYKQFAKDTQHMDISAVKDGVFIGQLKSKRNDAIKATEKARIEEPTHDKYSYGRWSEAYYAWREVDEYINDNELEIYRAKRTTNFTKMLTIISLAVGLVGIALAVLIYHFS